MPNGCKVLVCLLNGPRNMFPPCILTFLITRVSMPAAIFSTLAKTNYFLLKICDLIRMILTMNNFSFNNEHYLPKHGTAMGTRMAPSYANLFKGKFEQQAIDNSSLKPFIWWSSLRSWRDFVRECFCFGSEAVNASGEAVRGLVKSRMHSGRFVRKI